MNFQQEIIQLLSSRHFIICIHSKEEERLEYILNYISNNILFNHIYSWDFINGYSHNIERAKKNPLEALNFIETIDKKTKKIFFLKDFNKFMNDISIIRKLKNLSHELKTSNSYILISYNNGDIPTEITDYITYIELPLPNKKEIELEVKRLIQIFKIPFNIPIHQLVLAYQGFSIEQIRKSISKISSHKKFSRKILNYILQEKKQLISQTDLLEFYPSNNNLNDLGGLKNLKTWLQKRTDTFSIKAQNYGIRYPKGILLVGIQGTGKSMSAKAISLEWKLPLLKLDIGKIFAGIIGESESRARQMIHISEKISPCILWIDEIDKIFNKYTSNNDSGTTNRVINTLITWLSEKNNGVFIVATANDITNLPLEILRKGRFDEIFFLDLPNFEERLNIFTIHLKKLRPLSWNKYNIYYISKISHKFSGAEIEQAIIEAMHNAFYENREFNTQDIIHAIQNLVPIAFIDSLKISQLQELAHTGKIRIA
uniref:Uncharacterized AAA domain-containing protein ycf46 n=1 Tax=Sphondylothamnion multifidum TaxID=193186 RepID=A0A4D6X4S6_9FLOR|nr:hypothetical protein [Sphondylothamnion multifidum]